MSDEEEQMEQMARQPDCDRCRRQGRADVVGTQTLIIELPVDDIILELDPDDVVEAELFTMRLCSGCAVALIRQLAEGS